MTKRPPITKRQIASYVLLPGIVPQLKDLLVSGFGFIAVCLAQVYGAVRLLPAGHPYLLPANAGRFGVRHVVMAAASRLSYRREHIDQIVVFYLMLAGLAILVMQFLLLFCGFLGHAAHAFTFTYPTAVPASFQDIVGTPPNSSGGPSEDVAFVLLDRVFGVPNFFTDTAGNSTCVAMDVPCFSSFNPYSNAEGNFPWPFHDALHGMLSFYSIGLLVIGALIFCYYIFAVAAETAQTGTPFGRRFNHVWAPIRMVAALGLLIPLQMASGGSTSISGLNSAQYILLYAAKWGSGFATNGWNVFTGQVIASTTSCTVGVDTMAGCSDSLIAAPNRPDIKKLVEFLLSAETCRAAYEELAKPKQIVRAYLVRNSADTVAWEELDNTYTYNQALTFYGQQDVRLVFGSCLSKDTSGKLVDCDVNDNDPIYEKNAGYVKPLCGEIDLPISGAISSTTNPGAYTMEEGYFNLIRDTWLGGRTQDDGVTSSEAGYNSTTKEVCSAPSPGSYKTWLRHWGYCFLEVYGKMDNTIHTPNGTDLDNLLTGGAPSDTDPTSGYDYDVQQIIDAGVKSERASNEWAFSLQNLGWAGAGVWYNKIAQMNGAVINAANNLPRIKHYPRVMESVAAQRIKNDSTPDPRSIFDPKVHNGDIQVEGDEIDAATAATFATVLFNAYHLFDPIYQKPSGDTVSEIIAALFGERNLFNLRKNCTSTTDPNCVSNTNVTPIALLAGLGDSLINGAVIAMGLSGGATLVQVLGGKTTGAIASAIGSVATSLGILLLTTGFVLYYVVPFLPFLYFFFAVAAWVKGIFEAMVGVPLWALAHIRIDGEGLAGQAAVGGYYMMLEIFLRPILIVFGMLASIVLFAGQVFVLNDIWDLVTSNLTGFDHSNTVTSGVGSIKWMRGWMDRLFFTILYAFVVYMLGTSAFKLILLLPKGIMRWMGTGVGAFSDQEGDPAEGLVGRIQAGGSIAGNMASNAMQGVSKGATGVKEIVTNKPAQ